jgi:hypothetical protein
MRLKKRVEGVELALARRNGDFNFKVVICMDGENDDEARKKTGLTDRSGPIIFISEIDAKL